MATPRCLRTIVVLAVLAAVPVVRPAAAEAGEPVAAGGFVGIVAEHAYAADPAKRHSTLKWIRDVGVGTVRQTLDWASHEPAPGRFDWSRYDAWVRSTAKLGLEVLPILFNPPRWASSRPRRRAKRGTYPPRRFTDLARFAAAAARRYGPDGTFWEENPDVPRMPIRAWQVWNEPNLEMYWPSGPNPRQYVRMLRAVSRAIKQVDPDAVIVTGGMPQSRLGIPLRTYVRRMYLAGGRDSFDMVAVNPYARTPALVLNMLRGVRREMDRFGDLDAEIWVTEVGWSDVGPRGAFRLGPQGQARAIRDTMTLLWKERGSLRLRGMVYFNWRDAKPWPGGKDFWGLHTGLLRRNNTPKPAYYAFRDTAWSLR